MIGRLIVVAGGIAAGAVAAAAVWSKRKAELDAGAATGAASKRERGLTPLPPEPDPGSAPVRDEAPEAATAAGSASDDLQILKGLGAVSEQRLAEQGVTTFAQIAGWSDDELERIASAIKVSAERIRREDWVGQARSAAEAES